MIDDKVIQLPIAEEQQRKLAAQYEEEQKLPKVNPDRLRKSAFANVNTNLIIELLWETLSEIGFDDNEDTEQYMKDFHCVVEMLKGIIWRQLDMEHPVHKLMDMMVSQIEEVEEEE